MKKYLVTGGAGFIGSNYINYLLDKGKDTLVINLDKLTYAGNLKNLVTVEKLNNYQFVHGDIADEQLLEQLFNKYDFDYIVNFAAESHVDRSIAEPDVFIKTNIVGTHKLLEIARKRWLSSLNNKKFIQISTDEVYGELEAEGYFTEETSIAPRSPYSATKASADLLVMAYYNTYGLPINITRCSNNYGAYQYPEKLIPLVISKCLNHLPIPVYGDGLNIRDWLYVTEHCKAIDLVVAKGKIGEVYNIGGNNEVTNIDLVKNIIKIVQNKLGDQQINESLINFVKDRQGHDKRYAIDASKIKRELGWKNKTDFNVGLDMTIEWYLKNKQWLKSV